MTDDRLVSLSSHKQIVKKELANMGYLWYNAQTQKKFCRETTNTDHEETPESCSSPGFLCLLVFTAAIKPLADVIGNNSCYDRQDETTNTFHGDSPPSRYRDGVKTSEMSIAHPCNEIK